MFSYSGNRRLLIAATITVASCSQGDTPGLSGPSAVSAARDTGRAGSLAVGDVRTGPGTIEIDSVRMDRQNPAGVSVLRQYANPGQEYRMLPGETIELWVEYDRGDNDFPSGVAPNIRRLFVDWGEGEVEFTTCGSCKLTHLYPRPGRYTVKVTLDDGGGTRVTRTFYLNSLEAAPAECVPPTLTEAAQEAAEDEICLDSDSFNTSVFFSGTNLTFALAEGCLSQPTSDRVSKLGGFNPNAVFIDPLTGIVTTDGEFDYCALVTATNSCGSVSQEYDIETDCEDEG